MDSLADEFSNYVDIGSVASGAPCGLICSSSKKHSSDQTDDQQSNSKKHNFIYRNKTSKYQDLPCYLNNSNSASSLNKIKSKTKNRYSTRSSSILLKSNSLALSDSESTETTISNDELKMNSFFSDRKQKFKKPRRKKTDKDNNQSVYSLIPINNDQYYGKRKRSTTITQNTYEQTNSPMSAYTTNKLNKNEFNNGLSMQFDYNDKTNKLTKYTQSIDNKMEVENDHHDESSSSLSEESNLSDDPRFADDEQSDWHDSQLQKKNRRQYGRTSLEKTSSFGIVNPFSMLSSTPPSLNNFWKKRRKNVPNNHF